MAHLTGRARDGGFSADERNKCMTLIGRACLVLSWMLEAGRRHRKASLDRPAGLMRTCVHDPAWIVPSPQWHDSGLFVPRTAWSTGLHGGQARCGGATRGGPVRATARRGPVRAAAVDGQYVP